LSFFRKIFGLQPSADRYSSSPSIISALLPISDRVKERLNVDRAILLLSSFQCFWKDERPLDIFIVMPDAEQEAIEKALGNFGKAPNLNLHFVNETTVSPSIAKLPRGYGVAKHMLIKLAANRFVRSKFYLILDSDIVACKPMTADDLVIDGKALTYYYRPEPPAWWNCSEAVLNYPYNGYLASNGNRIFVTPEILSCEITSALQGKLEQLFNGDWIDGLIERFDTKSNDYWTEYTLYDLYAVETGLFEQYHVAETAIQHPLHCMEQSLWVPQHLENWDPAKAFNGQSPGYFLVLQSIMANDADFYDIRRRVIDAARESGYDLSERSNQPKSTASK
jgi:hypothetical protein